MNSDLPDEFKPIATLEPVNKQDEVVAADQIQEHLEDTPFRFVIEQKGNQVVLCQEVEA